MAEESQDAAVKATPPKLGGVVRWQWEKLAKARTSDEVKQVLADTAQAIGDGDVELRIAVPAKGYLKLMGDAYLAWRYGEIEKPGSKELLDRALAIYSTVYLRLLMKSRRERGR